jgi:hypothetical protein
MVRHRKLTAKLASAILMLLLVGCSRETSPDVQLNIQVEPSSRPGIFRVTGTTNLPDQSLIAIAAIRTLRTAPDNNTYAILARQMVRVERGNWETTLNLWQVTPDGSIQEAWQVNKPKLGLSATATPQVTFVAQLDPAVQPKALQSAIQAQGENTQNELIRFAPDGQWYLQASAPINVALPTGKTTPPIASSADINGGWGSRFVVKPPSSNLGRTSISPNTTSQTNAPLSNAEFMR